MRHFKVARRRNWQRHIQENAYQTDVLSDPQQKYWIEALPQPFAIQFDTQEETAIATATEQLWQMCVEFLDWFFTDHHPGDVDQRLAQLKIRPEYWPAIKASWDRTDPVEDLSLCTRFDLVVTEDGQIKLIEINGETPLLAAETIYQWNWLVDYQRNYQSSQFSLPRDASQFNEFWDRLVVQNFCNLLSRDVYSEGDAQSLYDYVMARQGEMSAPFLTMLELWLADELKHYEALRRTYHSLAGVDFADMDRHFAARYHEFEPLQLALEDEFTLLVTLMFDEIGSVYSYRRDLKEYYRHFGQNIERIGHHLVKDEGMHFNNAAEVLLACHRHRFSEVKGFLEKISRLESSLKTYYKTFFLDHAQEQHRFPQPFNQVISWVILARLGLGQRPSAAELKHLWQWVPEGYSLVPISSDRPAG